MTRLHPIVPLTCAVFAGILVAAAAVFAPAAFAAENPAVPPFTQSRFPTLTPGQLLLLQEAIRRGELTDDVRQIVRANPQVKAYLPEAWREQLEPGAESGGTDNTAAEKAPPAARAVPADNAARAPYDWRTSVYVSRLFLSRLDKEEAGRLVHFGHALFDPRSEAPSAGDSVPVPDDYVVGPGDEISVRLWGRLEGSHRMPVDRDGKIFFPKIGAIHVAGKTFGEVKTLIRNRVGGMAAVHSDVSLGRTKGFQVTVLGEVPAPGAYPVSSFQTVLQAIGLAGGIRDIGSLRRVQVKRGKDTVREIDVYGFLLGGDVTQDVRLLSGDAVFVPVAGPLVAVTGEVRREAIYELAGETAIADVLAMAGGLAPSAYKRRVQVERLDGNRSRVVVDLNLEDAGASLSSFALRDGDILRVLAVLPEEENVVTVEGNVRRPGKYEWKPGLSVGSLIPDAAFFLPDTFLDYALLTRVVGPERRKEIVPVNLRRIVVDRDAASDVPLKPMDELMVYARSAFRGTETATAGGEVRNPGEYEILPGTRVSDLVKMAGDLTRNASTDEAEVSRLDEARKPVLVKVKLGKALAGNAAEDIAIRDGDTLMVRPLPGVQEVGYVTVSGEMRSPGTYAIRRGERLSSVLTRAGGFTSDAFLRGAVFTRVSVRKRQQELIDRTVDQLEQEVARSAAKEGATALDKEDVEAQKQVFEARKALLEKLKQARAQGRIIVSLAAPEALAGTGDDIALEDGDSLDIPRPPGVINVMGRVYNPTAVVYKPSRETVGYYLRTVGGPTEDADREHIFVVRADGSVATADQGGGSFWLFGEGGLLGSRVEAGDAIVVPEKLVYTRVMKDVKDITQILYQIAVTAGVLIVAF